MYGQLGFEFWKIDFFPLPIVDDDSLCNILIFIIFFKGKIRRKLSKFPRVRILFVSVNTKVSCCIFLSIVVKLRNGYINIFLTQKNDIETFSTFFESVHIKKNQTELSKSKISYKTINYSYQTSDPQSKTSLKIIFTIWTLSMTFSYRFEKVVKG